MRYLIYLVFLICLCGLTAGLAPTAAVYGQAPNLLLLATFVWSLEKREPDYLFLAFAAGLFIDVYSGGVIGSFTLPFLAISLLLRMVIENFLFIDKNQKIMPLLLLPFIGTFYVFYLLVNWLLRRAGAVPAAWDWHYILPAGAIFYLYNLLFLYPVYFSISLLKNFIRKYIDKEYKAG